MDKNSSVLFSSAQFFSEDSSKSPVWKKILIAMGVTAMGVTAMTVSGSSASAEQTAQSVAPAVKTAVVQAVPGSPKASGKALLAAVRGARAARKLDGDQRLVIQVEPGVYDIAQTPLQLTPGLYIQGSGTDTTVIVGLGQSFGGADFSFNRGVVIGADDAGLRHLTLHCVNTPELDSCITMANYQASPRLENIRILATEGEGAHWGLRNNESSPRLNGVEIVVSGGAKNYGMVNVGRGARPRIVNSSILASGGTSDNIGILNKLEGLPSLLKNSEIIASGGFSAIGVWTLEPGNFALTEATKNARLSTMMLINTEVSAIDASRSHGFWQGQYRLVLRHSMVISDHSTLDVGFMGDIHVTSSELHGSEYFARGNHVRIAGSTLMGGGEVDGFSTERCIGIRTESGTVNTCP